MQPVLAKVRILVFILEQREAFDGGRVGQRHECHLHLRTDWEEGGQGQKASICPPPCPGEQWHAGQVGEVDSSGSV